jgi:murein DD-endopeptidase MepM/ murein hydrolase activator NlpD
MRVVSAIFRSLRLLLVLLCVVCLLIAIPASADLTYLVKRNDTLFAIAHQYGVTPAQLASRNGIARDTQVYVGQKLIVPVKSAKATKETSASVEVSLSPFVQRSITKAPVSPGRWKYIVIHHSGADEGTLKSIDRYHREERHMENGLAYHFLIGNGHGMGDGEIAVGNRWKEQLDGGHLRSEEQNKIALGICLIGNFDKTKPTEKQLRSLETLIRVLMKRCNLTAGAVKTHQQINIVRTECPGDRFPTRAFLAKLKKAEPTK